MKQFKLTAIIWILSFPMAALAADTPATMYKNPGCTCCDAYANYLRENGYDVNVIAAPDLTKIRRAHKVQPAFDGCHTVLIGNYVFEGHIPVESINRVLKERPIIRGLSVPGMPSGSPGMGGAKQGPLEVYYLDSASQPRVYATH